MIVSGNEEESSFPTRVFGQFTLLEGHVSKLEGRVSALETGMAELGATTRNTLAAIQNQSRDIKALGDRLNTATPWTIIIGGGSLILAIITVVGSQAISPIRADVAEMKLEARNYETVLRDHMVDGHPQRVEEAIAGVSARLKDIEGKRYSDNDASQDVQLKMLTSELSRVRDTAPDVRIQFLEKEFERLRGKMEKETELNASP